MLTHNQLLINPQSYGLVYDVVVKKICVCCTLFADALILKHNLLLYQLFWKAGIYSTLLEFMIVIMIILTRGIAY